MKPGSGDERSDRIPGTVNEDLDAMFASVAPPGAAGTEVQDLFQTLLSFRFSPEIPIEASRDRFSRSARFVKKVLRPVTSWQLRHLTDQLNAYSALQAEILRRIQMEREGS